MAVCKYFLEGRCKFGARCRNEHIQTSVTEDRLVSDLKPENRPMWPLSGYSNVFTGDISPEELRFEAYTVLRQGGNLQEIIRRQEDLAHKIEVKIAQVLANPRDALNHKLHFYQEKISSKSDQFFQPTSVVQAMHNPFMSRSSSLYENEPVPVPNPFTVAPNSHETSFKVEMDSISGPIEASSQQISDTQMNDICQDTNLYSVEATEQSDLDAYAAFRFEEGKIPELPPPRKFIQ